VERHPTVHGFFFAVVRRIVAEGAGVAIVDALNGCLPLNDGVCWRPFAPEIRYETALIVKAGAELSLPALAFIQMIRDEMRERATLPEPGPV
jgi:DNA-binding transcriptional LysR family regulator